MSDKSESEKSEPNTKKDTPRSVPSKEKVQVEQDLAQGIKKKKRSQKKAPAPESPRKKAKGDGLLQSYTVKGEVEVRITPEEFRAIGGDPTMSNRDIVIDSFRQKFTKGLMKITYLDKNHSIEFTLDAVQVELLLKLLAVCDGGYSAEQRELIEEQRKCLNDGIPVSEDKSVPK